MIITKKIKTSLLITFMSLSILTACKRSDKKKEIIPIAYAMVSESILPVRGEPSELVEQYTQLFKFETCTILEEIPHWNKIITNGDSIIGWVDSKMLTRLSKEEYTYYSTTIIQEKRYAMVKVPIAYALHQATQQLVPLTAGTKLPNYAHGKFEVLGEQYSIDSTLVLTSPLPITQKNVIALTTPFLNIPYLWAGKSGMGMDCSGFTQTIYSLFGYSLPRNSRGQNTQGTEVPSLKEAQAGDLVFFDHGNGRISHVGLLWDKEHLIHCSGRVKVESIDSTGIIFFKNGEYTHRLVSIRRL